MSEKFKTRFVRRANEPRLVIRRVREHPLISNDAMLDCNFAGIHPMNGQIRLV
jgi:hypothetical protein